MGMMGMVPYRRFTRLARPARLARLAHLALAWLVLVGCGRIGFDPSQNDASSDGVPADAPAASIDAGFCEYLPICMPGQITCCTATSSFCTLDGPGICVGGSKALCSVFNHQGCPPGWACCITPQRPEASCYDPLLPQPC
jgi:hypothetical protein